MVLTTCPDSACPLRQQMEQLREGGREGGKGVSEGVGRVSVGQVAEWERVRE